MLGERRSQERVSCAQSAGKRREQYSQRLVVELVCVHKLAGLFHHDIELAGSTGAGWKSTNSSGPTSLPRQEY